MMEKLFAIFVAILLVDHVSSHGRLMDPPSRSSAWRIGWPTPHNYDDNALYCGGFARMVNNGGRCGICGDPYDGPRQNEAGGKYATGIIFKNYTQGAVFRAQAEITANHCGHMEFRICPNNNVRKEATKECLDKHVLQLADGSGSKWKVPCGKTGYMSVNLKLPDDLVCSQCVLQWKYHAGNSWGVDPITKRGCVGCGAQEEFYGCSDVQIFQSDALPQPAIVPSPTTAAPRPITRRTAAPIPTTRRPVVIVNPTQPPVVNPMPVQIGAQVGVSRCHAINLWAGDPTLDKWCIDNCAIGNCPSLACDCPSQPVIVNPPTTQKPTTTTPKPTTTTTTPTTTTTTPTTTTPTTTTTSTTTRATTPAGPSVITRTECKAINLWAGNEYLDRWCADACARGNCPKDSCACTQTQITVTKATQEPLITLFGTNAQPATNAPITGAVVNTVKVCKATSEWTGIVVFDQWCTNECNKGHCPASTCACIETPLRVLTTTRATPKPTTTATTTQAPTTTTKTTTTTTVKPTTTTAQVPARFGTCVSNGIVGGQYWDDWCQSNCDRGYCEADFCNCL